MRSFKRLYGTAEPMQLSDTILITIYRYIDKDPENKEVVCTGGGSWLSHI
jgi:hypothetical protein